MPIETVNAFFNGYSYYRGLLTQNQYGNGLVPTLLTIIPRAISLALGVENPAGLLSGIFGVATKAESPAENVETALSAADEVPMAITAASASAGEKVAVTTDPEATPIDEAAAGTEGTEGTSETPETPPAAPVDETETDETGEGTEESDANTGSEESEEPAGSDESESPNGSTDLSDGNMAEPGETGTGSGEDTGSGTDGGSDNTEADQTGNDGQTGDDNTGAGSNNSDSGDGGADGSSDGSGGGSDS